MTQIYSQGPLWCHWLHLDNPRSSPQFEVLTHIGQVPVTIWGSMHRFWGWECECFGGGVGAYYTGFTTQIIQDNLSILRPISLVTSAQSLWPHAITYTQVLGTSVWTFWGAILPTTLSYNYTCLCAKRWTHEITNVMACNGQGLEATNDIDSYREVLHSCRKA